MIQRVVDERRFNNYLYLEKIGITVDVNEMLLLSGRILSHIGDYQRKITFFYQKY
jgi:hypothetical protein